MSSARNMSWLARGGLIMVSGLCLASDVTLSSSGKYEGAGTNQPPAAVDGEPPARGVSDLTVEKVGEEAFRVGRVRIDARARTVTFPATVNMREHVIEYALVTNDGKTHESLFTTAARPAQIHLACLLARIASGQAESEVQVEVTWERNGPPARHPLHELLVLDERGSDGQEQTVRAMPPCPWLYTHPWPRTADQEGSIISLIRDPSALVNNGGDDRDDDDAHAPRTGLLPPKGIPVWIILSIPPRAGQAETEDP